jgi:hypothetical protein
VISYCKGIQTTRIAGLFYAPNRHQFGCGGSFHPSTNDLQASG